MIVFHTTTAKAAKQILKDGFRDRTGTYGTESEWSGVWVSDRPLDQNEGTSGATVLRIDLSITEDEMAQYEWVQEGLTYREWLVPADLLNSRGIVQLDRGD
jgi:hypothetical protein